MKTTVLSVAERIQALGKCPAFARVPAGDLSVLAEMVETEHLAQSEVLFERGEPCTSVYVIAAGVMDVRLPGRSEPVRRMGPGDLLGEYGMFSRQGRTATVTAETEAVLLSLDYPRFRAFLVQFPESALVLLEIAVNRLAAAEAKDGTNGRVRHE
jgi:CRP-like cAMP-binding protein